MNIKRIHLIRHGQSEANIAGITCGQLDSPLSKEGIKQILLASQSQYLNELIDLPCFTSPLARAHDTAKLLGFKNIHVFSGLMETNTGDFSLTKFSDLKLTHPEFNHYKTDMNAKYPNGESSAEMVLRSWKTFQELVENHKVSEDIVIVSHKGPLNSIACHLLGVSFESFPTFLFENNKITTLRKGSDDSLYWALERMNII